MVGIFISRMVHNEINANTEMRYMFQFFKLVIDETQRSFNFI